MGSSGSNTFGDYKPSGKDKCQGSIDTELDDVARSDFYKHNKKLPTKGVEVRVRPTLQHGRLAVEETKAGTAIGNLPTRFNYLLLCLKNGYNYEGTVTASRDTKLPVLEVHLDPV